MYAAIFVSDTEVTVYSAPTEGEILQALRSWYAQNLEDEERLYKPAADIAYGCRDQSELYGWMLWLPYPD